MATNGKTPYEIRLELLQLAQEHLRTTYERQMAFANESLRLATDAGWKTIEELKKLAPAPYTVDDIIKKAQELYGFVQKKD
jgi:hypothetical protein